MLGLFIFQRITINLVNALYGQISVQDSGVGELWLFQEHLEL